MFREFVFNNEKYIININDISYINMYENNTDFCLDIYLKSLPSYRRLEFYDNSDEEISRIYWLIRNWLIENK